MLLSLLFIICTSLLLQTSQGPIIAAAIGWYEFYFAVIKIGKYSYEIEKMHHRYGNDTLSAPRFQSHLIPWPGKEGSRAIISKKSTNLLM